MSDSDKKTLTRRRFCTDLMLSSAALGSLKAASRSAAAPPKPKIERKIKLGIVGLGHRGMLIGNACRDHGGFEITSVADYFESVLAQEGNRLGVPSGLRFSGLSGYKRVLDSGVEALLIEDVPYFYPEQAAAAVQAGVHMYLAKPFAIDIPGALLMQEVSHKATERKLSFHVDYQLTTDPANLEVAARIRMGGLGRLAHILSGGAGGPWNDPAKMPTIENLLREKGWLTRINLGGDDMLNYDIHILDGVTWAIERHPVSACGSSGIFTPRNGDSTDCGGVVFQFDDGVMWTHVTQALNNNSWIYNLSADIMGVAATARIGYWGQVHVRGGPHHYVGSVSNSIYSDGANANVSEFYRCITESDFSNPMAQRAVEGTITSILGREAMARKKILTRAELIQENKKLEADLRGLKQ